MVTYANVSIFRGKAYVTPLAHPEGTVVVVAIEPVFSSPLDAQELARVMEQALAVGHPKLSRADYDKMLLEAPRDDPVLKAAGVRSSRAFEKDYIGVGVQWHDDKTQLWVGDQSTHRWGDPSKEQIFPQGAAVGVVAHAIVRFWETYADPALLRRVTVYYVRDEQAILPTPGRTEAGFHIDSEPVSRSIMTAERLTEAVNEVLNTPPPTVTADTRFRRLMRRAPERDPLLAAVGVKSYKELRRETVVFTLAWRTDSTRLYITKAGDEASLGWRETRHFEPDAPVPLLVDEILKCAASHPWSE